MSDRTSAAAPWEPTEPAPSDSPRHADWRAILDMLATRHSCRDFDGTAIDRAVLAEIVRDGTEAPSSCNQQQWHFIVVDEPALKDRAREISGGNHHFAECSALIYLCFQKGWTHGNFSVVQSVAGAAYHMMLSAHLRGFSAIWNAGIGDKAALSQMLGVPATFELQGALAIGRPRPSAPAMKAPRRPFGEVHSWNRFERPALTRYPARPADEYPYFRIRNDDNPFAVWDPQGWSWGQVADFCQGLRGVRVALPVDLGAGSDAAVDVCLDDVIATLGAAGVGLDVIPVVDGDSTVNTHSAAVVHRRLLPLLSTLPPSVGVFLRYEPQATTLQAAMRLGRWGLTETMRRLKDVVVSVPGTLWSARQGQRDLIELARDLRSRDAPLRAAVPPPLLPLDAPLRAAAMQWVMGTPDADLDDVPLFGPPSALCLAPLAATDRQGQHRAFSLWAARHREKSHAISLGPTAPLPGLDLGCSYQAPSHLKQDIGAALALGFREVTVQSIDGMIKDEAGRRRTNLDAWLDAVVGVVDGRPLQALERAVRAA